MRAAACLLQIAAVLLVCERPHGAQEPAAAAVEDRDNGTAAAAAAAVAARPRGLPSLDIVLNMFHEHPDALDKTLQDILAVRLDHWGGVAIADLKPTLWVYVKVGCWQDGVGLSQALQRGASHAAVASSARKLPAHRRTAEPPPGFGRRCRTCSTWCSAQTSGGRATCAATATAALLPDACAHLIDARCTADTCANRRATSCPRRSLAPAAAGVPHAHAGAAGQLPRLCALPSAGRV